MDTATTIVTESMKSINGRFKVDLVDVLTKSDFESECEVEQNDICSSTSFKFADGSGLTVLTDRVHLN